VTSSQTPEPSRIPPEKSSDIKTLQSPESRSRIALPVDLVGGGWHGQIGGELRRTIFDLEVSARMKRAGT
jgi:hypothetical protein